MSPAALTFTPANWNVAQTVTVTGVDDNAADGDRAYTIRTGTVVSADPLYNNLNPADVAVVNRDNDVDGIIVTPIAGLETSENGGTASFTVRLASLPLLPVTVNINTSDASEGTVSTGSLTFGLLNWNQPQTVIITGVNDNIDDGDVSYTIVLTVSTLDLGYLGANPADVSVINRNDDIAGISVTPISGPTSETGTQATFAVALTSQPTANVTIALSSSDTSEGTLATGSLTFTPANWSTPQSVTVTGVDDLVADGNVPVTIITGTAQTLDLGYLGIDPADVALVNQDDDAVGINVISLGNTTTEAGGQAVFSITLNSQPTANVTVGLSSSNPAEGTLSALSLTFTPANWNVAQNVTITGVDDFVADGNVTYALITTPAQSADPGYQDLDAADMSVINLDDDVAGITVSPVSGNTTEAGGQASFQVVLNSRPTANVTISLANSNPAEGTLSNATLTFTPATWNVAQTVVVTGVDDFVADGNITYAIQTGPAISADAGYAGLDAADVTLVNRDDDAPGINVSAISGPTSEPNGQATFTVVLTSQPTANVTIPLSTSDATEGTVSPASLTFTPADWNVPQTVTVVGADDFSVDGDTAYQIILGPAVSSDPLYNNLDPADVGVVNRDNDVSGIIVTPITGLETSENGGTASFTVQLTSLPLLPVTVNVVTSDASEGTVSTGSITFGLLNWNQPQTIIITGVDDQIDDGDVGYTIVLTVSTLDLAYLGADPADVSVINRNDDVAGISVTPISGPTSEAGNQATFAVVLTSQPTANVTIALASSDLGEGSLAVSSLTFTPANWSTPQSVTVTGVDDFVDDGDATYAITLAPAVSGDAKYSGLDPADVVVTNTDNDVAGIQVTPISGPTSEAGANATFSIVLTSQPTANVTISLSSSNPGEGSLSTSTLTFTPANWKVSQIVTVTGVDDLVDDGDVDYAVTIAAVSGDAQYDGLSPADVAVTNIDDDVAGIIVTLVSGPTTEAGGQATFSVVLSSQPTANVSIAVSSSDPTESTVAAVVSFTPGTWNLAQVVTITGIDDFVDDGDQAYQIVLAPATSSDPLYNGLDAADVNVTNADDDTVGILITPISGPTTEAGGQATFAIVLNSQPTADVSFDLTSSDVSEGTVSPATLTFTAANWNVPQVVTVTGSDDFVTDGDQAYTIVTSPAQSADAGYRGLDAGDVNVINRDDDRVGIEVRTNQTTTTEAGGQAFFTVVLDSQPTANVTISLGITDANEAVLDTTSLTFTPANWNIAQTVLVTGIDDTRVDGNVGYSIVTLAAESADTGYDGLDAGDLSFINVDDDVPTGLDAGVDNIVYTTIPTVPQAPPPAQQIVGSPLLAPPPEELAEPVALDVPTQLVTGSFETDDDLGAETALPPSSPPQIAVNVPSSPELPADVVPTEPTLPLPMLPMPTLPMLPTDPPPFVASQAGATSPVPGIATPSPRVPTFESADRVAQITSQSELLHEHLDPIQNRNSVLKQTVTAAFATGVIATAGYALISTRLASWLFTLLASRPLWKQFDVLEILFAWNEEQRKGRGTGEDESLQALVRKKKL